MIDRRSDVKCEKSFAYNNRCLNVLSATTRRKMKIEDNAHLSINAINIMILPLKRGIYFKILLTKYIYKIIEYL